VLVAVEREAVNFGGGDRIADCFVGHAQSLPVIRMISPRIGIFMEVAYLSGTLRLTLHSDQGGESSRPAGVDPRGQARRLPPDRAG
jgi:hypothetical protein